MFCFQLAASINLPQQSGAASEPIPAAARAAYAHLFTHRFKPKINKRSEISIIGNGVSELSHLSQENIRRLAIALANAPTPWPKSLPS
jgi:hypothetical protein